MSSIGIQKEGEVVLERFLQFIQVILQTKRKEMYRMKGILNLRGTEHKLVFHSVHDQFNRQMVKAWGDKEKRINKIVFIGKDLDRQYFLDGFENALAKPGEFPDKEPAKPRNSTDASPSAPTLPGGEAFQSKSAGPPEGATIESLWEQLQASRAESANRLTAVQGFMPVLEDMQKMKMMVSASHEVINALKKSVHAAEMQRDERHKDAQRFAIGVSGTRALISILTKPRSDGDDKPCWHCCLANVPNPGRAPGIEVGPLSSAQLADVLCSPIVSPATTVKSDNPEHGVTDWTELRRLCADTSSEVQTLLGVVPEMFESPSKS